MLRHLVLLHGMLLVVLYSHAAQPNTPPLVQAALRKDWAAVRQLVQAGADVNAVDADSTTALQVACLARQADVITLLLNKGANPNLADQYGQSPLLMLCNTFADDQALVLRLAQQLHKAGASLTHRNGHGENALHLAARYKLYTLAGWLLQQKLPLELATELGETPLLLAADDNYNDSARTIQLLLAAGADVQATSALDQTVYDLAGPQAMLALLAKQPDVHAPLRKGGAAMHLAVARGFDAVVAYLLQRGANASQPTLGANGYLWDAGDTPLHVAVRNQQPELIKLLLARGAQPNVVNAADDSPLELAQRLRASDLVLQTLEAGGATSRKTAEFAMQRRVEGAVEGIKLTLFALSPALLSIFVLAGAVFLYKLDYLPMPIQLRWVDVLFFLPFLFYLGLATMEDRQGLNIIVVGIIMGIVVGCLATLRTQLSQPKPLPAALLLATIGCVVALLLWMALPRANMRLF